MVRQPNQSRTNPGPNIKSGLNPNSIPEPDQPEHQTPDELPEHQVEAARKHSPAGEPIWPERQGRTERETPPPDDEEITDGVDDQKNDPEEGQGLH